jgi:hypothetical protein
MITNIRFLKRILFPLPISFLLILAINTFSIASSQNSKVYVSLGIWENSTTIVLTESLQIGREWAVFGLAKRRYWGNAKVISSNYSLCSASGGGVLTTKKSNHEGNGLVALIRPMPSNPSRAKIKQIKYAELPTLFQNNFSKYVSDDKYFIYYTIDINSDNLVDIVVIKYRTEPDASLYVRYNKEWINKGGWSPGC